MSRNRALRSPRASIRKQEQRPGELAVALVDEWFQSLVATIGGQHGAHVDRVSLDDDFEENNAFSRVADALEHEYYSDGSTAENERDELVMRAMFMKEAGYLIGVQVGLRLRSGGR